MNEDQFDDLPAGKMPELETEEIFPDASEPREAGENALPDAAEPETEDQGKPEMPRRSKTATLIFYTLYILLILVFLGAVALARGELNSWLTDYQLSQPTDKRDQVFAELFESGDWDTIYTVAGIEDTLYEGVDAFRTYMAAQVEGKTLELVETSAGLSGDRKYFVKLGERSIASFLLTAHADPVTGTDRWELANVDVYFLREETVTIRLQRGQTAYVNGAALSDDLRIRREFAVSLRYLPTGVYPDYRDTFVLDGLLVQPEITVRDASGEEVSVSRDPDTGEYTTGTPEYPTTIPDDTRKAVNAAMDAYGAYLAGETETLPSCFDRTTDVWPVIRQAKEDLQEGWTVELTGKSVENYRQYGDDLFSVTVGMEFLAREIPEEKDGTTTKPANEKNTKILSQTETWFFRRQEDDWRCIAMTAEAEPEGAEQVRIRFVVDGVPVSEYFYDTTLTELVVPVVSVADGMRFAGWYQRENTGDGTLSLALQPDETGRVVVTEEFSLRPMTVYAVVEPEPVNETEEEQ